MTVGTADGLDDGSRLGLPVGHIVGSKDGMCEGERLGELDGAAVDGL